MSDGEVFVNQGLFWPVLLIGLLLWGVYIWKEWPQRTELRFWIKLIIAFLAITSLAMIVLKPGVWEKSSNGKGIILTEGYRPAQLDSLRAIYKRIPQEEYVTGRNLTLLDEADSLFLLGHGLASFDLWQVAEKSVAYLGGKDVEGWTQLSKNDELVLGEPFELKAKYINPQAGHWAFLTDNGGNPLDSVPFEEQAEQNIILRANPKTSGQLVYHILEKSEGEILSDEPLPIHVVEGNSLKILMVNTFPTFETKYLKNFLAERGHEVLARTQLTKGKYKFEYFNGASNPIYGLSTDNLQDYDLLIIDTDSYLGLGSASKLAMEEAIGSNGMGVFIQPSESFFTQGKGRTPFNFNRDFSTEITLGKSKQPLQKYPYTFQEDLRTQEVLVDSVALAAYIPIQYGKTGTTLLQNTYQLVLDGDEALYARIWTQVLNSIAKEKDKEVEWEGITAIPRPNQPFEFELRTMLGDMDIISADGANIPLIQNSVMPTKWTGKQYPRKTGWNQLRTSQDSIAPFSYFVFDDDQLESISESKTLETNQREFGSENTFTPSVSETKNGWEPISPLWFYFLLLFGLGWLWLEPKLAP
ncbi:hypothetical protein [Flagellimonas oceanensis]|uniref:hypothetical protein n=1 Tax=Flagellimonas oceanensis TaxID=2499163 RepID=UPI003BAC0537|tara:strand:- start:5929 stop:7680 length:1752 start_codon:yes stop_codon:yes gene_type:complete